MRDVCFDQMLDHRVARVKLSRQWNMIGLRLVVELRLDLTRLNVIHALPAIRTNDHGVMLNEVKVGVQYFATLASQYDCFE